MPTNCGTPDRPTVHRLSYPARWRKSKAGDYDEVRDNQEVATPLLAFGTTVPILSRRVRVGVVYFRVGNETRH